MCYRVKLNADFEKAKHVYGTTVKIFRSLKALLGWMVFTYGKSFEDWTVECFAAESFARITDVYMVCSLQLLQDVLEKDLSVEDDHMQIIMAGKGKEVLSHFEVEECYDKAPVFSFTEGEEKEMCIAIEKDYEAKSKKGRRLMDLAIDYDFGKNGKTEDFARAVECYEKCIWFTCSPLAYHNLGYHYSKGEGVNEDKQKGFMYYEQAALLGYPLSGWLVGQKYEKGFDDGWGKIRRDFSKAIRYYKIAAEGGHTQAAYRLGVVYRDGEGGVEKDLKQAFKFFKIAAAESDKELAPKFWCEYAICLLRGHGTAKNVKEGEQFMRKAAEQGNTDAQLQMAYLCEGKDNGEWLRWMSKSAEGGNADAAFAVGEKYSNDPNPAFAIKYLRQAARHGHYMAGVLLQELEGKEQRVKLAVLEKAAQRGDAKAQYRIGMMYLKGDGVDENSRVGVDWLESAAKLGDKNAAAELGWCYLKGIGVPRANGTRAFEWFSMAVGEGRAWKTSRNLKALKGLSVCYDEGIGVEMDKRFAHELKMKFEIAKLYKAAGV